MLTSYLYLAQTNLVVCVSIGRVTRASWSFSLLHQVFILKSLPLRFLATRLAFNKTPNEFFDWVQVSLYGSLYTLKGTQNEKETVS